MLSILSVGLYLNIPLYRLTFRDPKIEVLLYPPRNRSRYTLLGIGVAILSAYLRSYSKI